MKRPEKWWEVYRAIRAKLHPGYKDGDGFFPSVATAADAAFDALELPKFIKS